MTDIIVSPGMCMPRMQQKRVVLLTEFLLLPFKEKDHD